MKFFYTYVLLSEKEVKYYTGYTKDLKLRFEQHNNKSYSYFSWRKKSSKRTFTEKESLKYNCTTLK